MLVELRVPFIAEWASSRSEDDDIRGTAPLELEIRRGVKSHKSEMENSF